MMTFLNEHLINLIKNNTCFKGDGSCIDLILTLIWVGSLGVRFEVAGGGGKIIPPPLPPLSKAC